MPKQSYEFGPFVLRPAEWSLQRGGVRVELPPKALAVLLLLVERAGSLVLTEDILKAVWKDTFVEEANVAVYVAAIRRVLDDPPGTNYIETVRTRGYRFAVPVVVQTEVKITGSDPEPETIEIADVPPARPVTRRRNSMWAGGVVLGMLAVFLSPLLRDETVDSMAVSGVVRSPAGLPTASGQAHDYYLQAREQWKRRSPENVRLAIGLYEKALAIDPNFALAYAGLANCYNITNSGLPAQVRYPLAKRNAEKAIELDPGSAEAHTAMAFMRYKLEWRWRDADTEFRKAVTLNPKYDLAHHWYGEFLRLMGKTAEGIAELKVAVDLEPESLGARSDLVSALVQGNHLSEARAHIDEGLKIDPGWSTFPYLMSAILLKERREKESVEHLLRFMTLRSFPINEVNELREAFAAGGMPGMLRAQANQYLRLIERPASSNVELATSLSYSYAQLGDREEAFSWLKIAIDLRQDAGIHLLTNPAYDSIRNDPRFDQLLERLNLKNF